MQIKRVFLILFYCFSFKMETYYDVTVVGYLLYADGLGRLSIGFIDTLKDDLKINFIPTRKSNLANVPQSVKDILKFSTNESGRISILFDALWYPSNCAADFMPNSLIKIAYSMIESTEIPKKWVELLNDKFDAVLVPDDWLVGVYKKSGVKIPIFVLPCGLYLEDFLNKPVKKNELYKDVFIFGTSMAFDIRKNHELLLDAFYQEFKNAPNVKLKIHARSGGNKTICERLKNKIKKNKIRNVEIIWKSLAQEEYLKFMYTLDCFVSVSKGEGFSVPSREALALGIPCILSNNTAHKTIGRTGFVEQIRSNILETAYYTIFRDNCGYNFNCNLEDVKKALRTVYENYSEYLKKAQKGREWVKQYLYNNLKFRYLTLIKPKEIIYSEINSINEDGSISTNSTKLFDKYKRIMEV